MESADVRCEIKDIMGWINCPLLSSAFSCKVLPVIMVIIILTKMIKMMRTIRIKAPPSQSHSCKPRWLPPSHNETGDNDKLILDEDDDGGEDDIGDDGKE